jgi:hypothetical protein
MPVDSSCLPAGKNESGQSEAISKVMRETSKKYQSIYICIALALTTAAVYYKSSLTILLIMTTPSMLLKTEIYRLASLLKPLSGH